MVILLLYDQGQFVPGVHASPLTNIFGKYYLTAIINGRHRFNTTTAILLKSNFMFSFPCPGILAIICDILLFISLVYLSSAPVT